MNAPVHNLALTGGIACGKSTALRFFAEEGAAVIDADDVAHRWMAAGALGPGILAAEFGPGILASDGAVDRPALARIVFADRSALARLNALSHPAIRQILLDWRDAMQAAGRLAVAAIPLLFESGWEADWDATVCITAPEEEVLVRLAARGLTPEQARARIASQLPLDEKARRADLLLPNPGTLPALRASVRSLLSSLPR